MKVSSTSAAGFVGAVLCSALLCAPGHAQQQGFPWEPDRAPSQFWIGRSNEPCKRISGRGGVWAERAVHAIARQQAVDWTCSYVWTSAQSATPDLAALRRNGVLQVEPDAPVVLANAGGDPERDAMWFEPLYALARQRLGIPKERETHSDRVAVRVAILDGATDSAGGLVDPTGHGRAVSRVVRELACGSLQRCAAQLVHVPALPLLSDSRRTLSMHPLEAGALGTRGMLAAASGG